MPSPRWPLLSLTFGLLLAGASACGAPAQGTSSQARDAAAVVAGIAGNNAARSPYLTATPRPAGASPIVVSASSGRAPTATPMMAKAALSAPTLRLPTDGRSVVVVNSTDSDGLWTRREPGGEPLRTWADGTPMLVIGEDEQADGRVWKQVQTLDGQIAWAAAEYLVPADEQVLAAALPGLLVPRTPAPVAPGVQARVAVTDTAPTPTPAPLMPVAPTATRRTVAIAGQAAPTQPPAAASSGAASAQATATPQPTATVVPTATPIRAPSGSNVIEAEDAVLTVIGTDRGMPNKIGNRPRDGMELAAVQVKIVNNGDEPLAVYRGAFRLSLSDRSRVEPLAGGASPLPYSTLVPVGGVLEGWLTFEVPSGGRTDAIIWAPDRGTTYAVGL
ncbi:MAG: hypothetical protein IT306_16290 [Chloroflexi bacterium]|nr:hypothetical protein [Chloroflexota bacterium]